MTPDFAHVIQKDTLNVNTRRERKSFESVKSTFSPCFRIFLFVKQGEKKDIFQVPSPMTKRMSSGHKHCK